MTNPKLISLEQTQIRSEGSEPFRIADTLPDIAQLVQKSKEEAIKDWTPRDHHTRFPNYEVAKKYLESLELSVLTKVSKDQQGDLAGIVWYERKPRLEADYTLAIRIYDGYGGRGLGGLLLRHSLTSFASGHPEENAVWLSVRDDNNRAIHLYETNGFYETDRITIDGLNRIVMGHNLEQTA